MKKAVEEEKAPKLEDKATTKEVSKPGSKCLGRRNDRLVDAESPDRSVEAESPDKGVEAESPDKGMECTERSVDVAIVDVDPGKDVLESPQKKVETGPRNAWEKGLIRSPFKLKAKRPRGPTVVDELGAAKLAIENLYSPDKTMYKDLAEIAGGSESPAVAPEPELVVATEPNVRTRARTQKEAEQAAEDSPPGRKVKGKRVEKTKVEKVGGALPQKRRRGAT